MRCEELLAQLNAYVDGTVGPGVCAAFENRMAGCNPCQVVVDTIRKTIALCQEGTPYDLPAPFRQRLHAVLREQRKQIHTANL